MADSYTAQWKTGFRKSAVLPADVTYRELEKIRTKHYGELDPKVVVDTVSANAKHKLRGFFIWDDTDAANRYRVEEARNLIRSIVVERPDKAGEGTRQYELKASDIQPRQQVYTTIEEILKDPDQRADLLKRALGELLAFQRRYRGLQELAIVFRSIDDTLVTTKV